MLVITVENMELTPETERTWKHRVSLNDDQAQLLSTCDNK